MKIVEIECLQLYLLDIRLVCINKTEQICIKALEEDGKSLQYIENQTEKLCLIAVKQD